MKEKIKNYIRLLRPEHYIKNFLIVFPAFFAGELFCVNNIIKLCLGFVAFSLTASIVYIINDIKDIEKDRKHETKRNRPIASGCISYNAAILVAIILIIITQLIIYALVGSIFNQLNLIIGIYLVANIAYSFGLKNMPIVDVMILATGFVLRVIFGGLLLKCDVSQWLCLTVWAFSLYMGLGKRRNELRKVCGENTRKVLLFYTDSFLSSSMLMAKTTGVVFYSFWSAMIVERNSYMIWTIPLVMAILMRYELDIEKDSFGDPVEVLLSDKYLIILCLFFAVFIFGIEYL